MLKDPEERQAGTDRVSSKARKGSQPSSEFPQGGQSLPGSCWHSPLGLVGADQGLSVDLSGSVCRPVGSVVASQSPGSDRSWITLDSSRNLTILSVSKFMISSRYLINLCNISGYSPFSNFLILFICAVSFFLNQFSQRLFGYINLYIQTFDFAKVVFVCLFSISLSSTLLFLLFYFLLNSPLSFF